MTISERSYGAVSGVAALVPRYAGTGGIFTVSTRPTLAQVERLIDQISAMINSMLSTEGFDIPITQDDVVAVLSSFVEEEVAAICEGINGSGRFGPTTKAPNKSRFLLIQDDIQFFLKSQIPGFERLGAERTYAETSGIGFRDSDEQGDSTFPIFQRDSFGKDGFFVDADSGDS